MAETVTKFKYETFSSIRKPVLSETGIIPLDIALGGGHEAGDLIELAGDTGTGKSTIGMHWCKNVVKQQKKRAAYLDVEQGTKESIIKNMGVADIVGYDPNESDLLLLKPETYKDIDMIMMDLMLNHDFDLLFIDSITALTSSKLQRAAVEDVQIGVKARLQAIFLEKYKPYCRATKTTTCFANQLRTNIKGQGAQMKAEEDSSGGKAVKFYPDTRLFLALGAQIMDEVDTITADKQKIPIGNDGWLWCKKNRFAPPFIKLSCPVMFGKGVSNIKFITNVAKNVGMISGGTGGFFKVPDGQGGTENVRGTDALEQWVRKNITGLQKNLKEKGHLTLKKTQSHQ